MISLKTLSNPQRHQYGIMVSMVTDLILAPGLWNHGLIDHIFNPIHKDIIMAIPLSIMGGEDRLLWHYDRGDIYTQLKADIIFFLLKRFGRLVSCSSVLSRWWKALWKLKILPKPFLEHVLARDSFEEVCVLLWLLWSERAAESARTSWSPSSGVGLKLNIDAAIRLAQKQMDTGFVFLNFERVVIAAGSKCYSGVYPVEMWS
ncbi:hypothetical protein TorRG33x02_195970 [Trema orientale]|uniref:Uncharacterized protein n=1 Tax=Trema orientale TaxID=63057 RepID=A0A2P5EGJ2_TREOI|nr:hypothetical protein TorRG33x02_195970 [Trema orientale]